jgi:hypothetical protein
MRAHCFMRWARLFYHHEAVFKLAIITFLSMNCYSYFLLIKDIVKNETKNDSYFLHVPFSTLPPVC